MAKVGFISKKITRSEKAINLLRFKSLRTLLQSDFRLFSLDNNSTKQHVTFDMFSSFCLLSPTILTVRIVSFITFECNVRLVDLFKTSYIERCYNHFLRNNLEKVPV